MAADPLYTSRMKRWSSVLLTLAACGGTQETGPTTGGSGAADNNPTGGDAIVEAGPVEIKGLVFEPEAMGRPGMPLASAKKQLSIENQRKVYQVQKDPTRKQAEAAILASMLFTDSKVKESEEAKKMITEARQALRDSAAMAKDKVDELTLRMLGSFEIQLEDWAASEKAWQALVDRAVKEPKNKQLQDDLPSNKAWWAFSLLKQNKNAEALAVVKAEQLSDKQPELAYVAAWAKWRNGDEPGALQGILAAAPGWGGTNREAFDRDVFLFAGRDTKTSVDAVSPQMFTIFAAKAPDQQYGVLAKLGLQSYHYAGRWQDAVNAIDKAITVSAGKAPANDIPVLRYTQADFLVRLDQPDAAARYAKQALDALPACGAKCSDKSKQELVRGVYGIGRMFHLLYATANDIRYYQPANDLYIATGGLIMDPAARTQAKADADNLAQTLKNTKAGTGTHQREAIGILLQRHNQEIQACYEKGLATNPKVGGSVTLNLESDETGAMKGGSTEPAAGAADLAAVAGCIKEKAMTWKLPKRGSKGATRIKMSYSLAPLPKK
jgi:hypothetical protein